MQIAKKCGRMLGMIEDQIAVGIPIWKKMVEDLGGRYEGVQLPFDQLQDAEPYVFFYAPNSNNVLGLPISHMTEDNVKQKMGLVSKKTHSTNSTKEHLTTILHRFWDLREELHILINELEEIRNNV